MSFCSAWFSSCCCFIPISVCVTMVGRKGWKWRESNPGILRKTNVVTLFILPKRVRYFKWFIPQHQSNCSAFKLLLFYKKNSNIIHSLYSLKTLIQSNRLLKCADILTSYIGTYTKHRKKYFLKHCISFLPYTPRASMRKRGIVCSRVFLYFEEVKYDFL